MVINSGNQIRFYDNVEWVGHKYQLYDEPNIIDSAQEVTKNQYRCYGDPNALMIFSFYPTKPVGGCDGGMVVSDNKNEIDRYRLMTLNGTKFHENNWKRNHIAAGYKMHTTSLQAYIANENLKKLDNKNERLTEICEIYNHCLEYDNTSKHLYRIRVNDNQQFVSDMKREGINCGIHYRHCHDKQFYGHFHREKLALSENESKVTVSLPFHELLTNQEVYRVIENVRKLANICGS
jgi:dTDP-4-amino-4,6-dideoxygalactose transaminase